MSRTVTVTCYGLTMTAKVTTNSFFSSFEFAQGITTEPEFEFFFFSATDKEGFDYASEGKIDTEAIWQDFEICENDIISKLIEAFETWEEEPELEFHT